MDAALLLVMNAGKLEVNIALSFKVGFGKVGASFGAIFCFSLPGSPHSTFPGFTSETAHAGPDRTRGDAESCRAWGRLGEGARRGSW